MFDENALYRSTSTKNEGDHDNKCMHSITNYTTDVYLVRVHLIHVKRQQAKKREVHRLAVAWLVGCIFHLILKYNRF